MPNRYLREGILTSRRVNSLGWQEEVFYRRLMSKVDDYGRYTADPALLRAALYPLLLDRVRDSDIPRLLASCEKAGLVFVYAIDGESYLVMNKWENGRAKTSSYPTPPAEVCERMLAHVYTPRQMRARAPDADSGTDPDSDTGASGSPATDGDWLSELSASPAYQGIDVPREFGKMQAWCSVNRKQPTKRRFVNWLNRVERPLTSEKPKANGPVKAYDAPSQIR